MRRLAFVVAASLALAVAAEAQSPTPPPVKITTLPQATSAATSDQTVLVQGGVTKRITLGALLGGTLGTNAFTSTAIPGSANPTATAGSAAVNGTALTYMRSDGAPPLPVASSSVLGIAKVDGTTITASGGVLTATAGGAGCTVSGAAGIVLNTGGSSCTTDTNATVVSGGFQTHGASGGYLFQDRSGSPNWQWYGAAGIARLYDGVADRIHANTSGVVTLPNATDTLVGLATADTLSNKTLVAPALGTPASGIATNLTGTAAGLTAGHVTTNANLTGPITSSGNATAIASQTGSGTKFVMDTGPTIAGGAISALTALAVRDTSAAFDLTLAGTSSTALSAGRTLTLDMKNVAHTLAFGNVANTITFPSAASYTVIGSGDTGTVTNTMLAGAITNAKLAGSITAANLVGTDIAAVAAPYFMASMRSGNQTLTSTVEATVLFDTDVTDSGSYYATGTGKFTPLVSGTYYVTACITIDATFTFATDNTKIYLKKNSTVLNRAETAEATGTFADTRCTSAIAALNGSTDFLVATAIVTGTTPIVVGGAESPSTFMAHRLGP